MRILFLTASLISIAYMQPLEPIEQVTLDINVRNILSPDGRFQLIISKFQNSEGYLIVDKEVTQHDTQSDVIHVQPINIPVMNEPGTLGYLIEFRTIDEDQQLGRRYQVYVSPCQLFMGIHRMELISVPTESQSNQLNSESGNPTIDISVHVNGQKDSKSRFALGIKVCSAYPDILERIYETAAQTETNQFNTAELLVQLQESSVDLRIDLVNVCLQSQYASVLNTMIGSQQPWFQKYLTHFFGPLVPTSQFERLALKTRWANAEFVQHMVRFTALAYAHYSSQQSDQRQQQPEQLYQQPQTNFGQNDQESYMNMLLRGQDDIW